LRLRIRDQCGTGRCAVNANGVRAEWIEATVATDGQPTVVLFHDGRSCDETVEHHAEAIATGTGARVLCVECVTESDGVIAYAWLLEEGLDLNTTSFSAGACDRGLAAAVRRAARARGLPVPRTRGG
jgi:hypothetical protein